MSFMLKLFEQTSLSKEYGPRSDATKCGLRPRGYKTFFLCSTHLSMTFFMLINLELLTIANVVLLNLAEHVTFSANKYENANYCWHFHIFWQRKFHAQLS